MEPGQLFDFAISWRNSFTPDSRRNPGKESPGKSAPNGNRRTIRHGNHVADGRRDRRNRSPELNNNWLCDSHDRNGPDGHIRIDRRNSTAAGSRAAGRSKAVVLRSMAAGRSRAVVLRSMAAVHSRAVERSSYRRSNGGGQSSIGHWRFQRQLRQTKQWPRSL